MSKSTATLAASRDLPDDELRQNLARTRDELFRLHLGMHTNQVTSSALLTTKRREIAQIMTVLSNRKNGLEKQGAPAQAAKTETIEAAPEATEKKSKAKKKA
ncbi:MAG: 50S ribosomal protein L29 [Proteobacteria bacterium]|nr:50S ribosomal protein L29 [Pseudomonadota bacterium]